MIIDPAWSRYGYTYSLFIILYITSTMYIYICNVILAIPVDNF